MKDINYPLLMMAVATVGCATMQSNWEEAKLRNTNEAYEEFLRRYPNSRYNDSLQLKWFKEGVKSDTTSPGPLFILSTGYAFNGIWGDNSIVVEDLSAQKSIDPVNIASIYKDRFGATRLVFGDGTESDARIVGGTKVRTNSGGLIIDADDLVLFHTGIETSADKIHRFVIIEKHMLELTERILIDNKKQSSQRLITGHTFLNHWRSKVLTLSDPTYIQTIDDPTKPIEFSFEFLRHSDSDDKEVIVFWTRFERRMGNYVEYTVQEWYDHTPIDVAKGEAKRISIYLTLFPQYGPLVQPYGASPAFFEGRGYLVVYVVPAQLLGHENRNYLIETVNIKNTISNVLRLPIEIRSQP
jgi:hypothetical protein